MTRTLLQMTMYCLWFDRDGPLPDAVAVPVERFDKLSTCVVNVEVDNVSIVWVLDSSTRIKDV